MRSPTTPAGGVLAVLLAVCPPALGADRAVLDCAQLPADQRRLCEALAACSGRADAEARKACFDAAYRDVSAAAGALGDEEAKPAVAAPVRQAATGVTARDGQARTEPTATASARDAAAAVVPRVESPESPASKASAGGAGTAVAPRVESPATPAVEAAQTAERGRDWFRWFRRKPAAEPSAEHELPERLDAVAQGVWRRIRGGQVVLLDNGLLLEGRGGPASRIKAGDAVQVRVAKTLGGETYFLTAPSRRTFEMARLGCDRPAAEDVRKCAAARRKNPDAGW